MTRARRSQPRLFREKPHHSSADQQEQHQPATFDYNESFVRSPHAPSQWIRGVNLGGWLVLERYITPYMFSITDCHTQGQLCWFPGQLSDEAIYDEHTGRRRPLCSNMTMPSNDDTTNNSSSKLPPRLQQPLCTPFNRMTNVFGRADYPMDEWSLGQAFQDQPRAAAEWLNVHLQHFVTPDDLRKLVDSGVTHVRVPLPHWILEQNRTSLPLSSEPWIVADRWKYFVRFLGWCRTHQIQVWPDMHTAPGSQNGFDNSGQVLAGSSCQNWSRQSEHVQRLLTAIQTVTQQIVKEGYGDVVTGFGLLNEPFKDCDKQVYEGFVNAGLEIVRQELGRHAHVYIR
jgi:glucan 1,3-beta-glucosidase